MIAHVAAAGEDKGRVVLRLGAGVPASDIALEAAVAVARAFQSEIESLFVEDRQLFELASYPFAREISFSGRSSRALSVGEIEREVRLLAAGLQRKVNAIARRAEVRVRARSIRDEPVQALAQVCAQCGPWNVVALAEPLTAEHASALGELFARVADATGVIVVGAKTRRTSGPVVVIVEELDRLPPMLRAADRLAAALGSDVRLVLAGADREHLAWLEGQARLFLVGRAGAKVEAAELAHAERLLERLRRLSGGFAIAQFGGLVASAQGDLRPLLAALECPLFLVR
jgi:hypothetical protein